MSGQTLEAYLAQRPQAEGGPEALLPGGPWRPIASLRRDPLLAGHGPAESHLE